MALSLASVLRRSSSASASSRMYAPNERLTFAASAKSEASRSFTHRAKKGSFVSGLAGLRRKQTHTGSKTSASSPKYTPPLDVRAHSSRNHQHWRIGAIMLSSRAFGT